LQDLAVYKTEKPYWCFLPPHEGFDPDQHRVDNLEFEARPGIKITDIRDIKDTVELDNYGFQVLSHYSKVPEVNTKEAVAAYKRETEVLLQDAFKAVTVKCYELILRENVPFFRKEFDLNDPLHTEGPARGAHNGDFIFSAWSTITE
jgi:hypothetical protein